MRKLALILLLAPLAGFGQSLATLTPQQCVSHAGDDPDGKQGWANPNLNDTGWTALSDWSFSPTQPRNWLRCHLTAAQLKAIEAMDDPHLALEVGGGYQLFFQGRQIGSFGNLSTGDYSVDDLRSYALPRKAEQGGTIALRLTFRGSDPVLGHFALGSPDTLAGYRALYILDSVRPILPYVIGYCIAGILGFLPLGLFYYDRDRRDLLWLGLLCIATAMLKGQLLLPLCFGGLFRTCAGCSLGCRQSRVPL